MDKEAILRVALQVIDEMARGIRKDQAQLLYLNNLDLTNEETCTSMFFLKQLHKFLEI